MTLLPQDRLQSTHGLREPNALGLWRRERDGGRQRKRGWRNSQVLLFSQRSRSLAGRRARHWGSGSHALACCPLSARWDGPPPAAWGSRIPARRLGRGASPRQPSLSPLTPLLPWWGSCTRDHTGGGDERPRGARGPGEAGTGSPKLPTEPTPGVSRAPPQRRVGSAAGTHATWLLTKDHRRATQTDVSHHTPASLEPSDRPLDKMLTHGALLAAQRHGGPGSRPSAPCGRAPKQTLSPSPVPRGGRGTRSAVSVHRGVTHSILRLEQKRTRLFARATRTQAQRLSRRAEHPRRRAAGQVTGAPSQEDGGRALRPGSGTPAPRGRQEMGGTGVAGPPVRPHSQPQLLRDIREAGGERHPISSTTSLRVPPSPSSGAMGARMTRAHGPSALGGGNRPANTAAGFPLRPQGRKIHKDCTFNTWERR